ncbi:MAG: hypothetical protein ACKV2Q_34195 [Planctomycetaceae bacterium]
MIAVFTRILSDDLASLVKQIDKLVVSTQDRDRDHALCSYVVLITPNEDADKVRLKNWGHEHGISPEVPLVLWSGEEGPQGFGISPAAAVTVFLWKEAKVVRAYGYRERELDAKASELIVKEAKRLIE